MWFCLTDTFLPPGRIFVESIQDTSGRARTNRVAHHESLQAQVVVYGDINILLGPQIAFGGLDGRMSKQELVLLQLPAVLPTQFRASPAQVVGAEMFNPDLFR